jgi:modulator of FtsH protease HflC
MDNNQIKQKPRRFFNFLNVGNTAGPRIFKFFKIPLIIIVLLFVANIIANMFFFTVNEYNQAIVTRFGEMREVILAKRDDTVEQMIKNDTRFRNINIKYGKGLFTKMPFIDSVEYYDSRLLTYDTDAREVTTIDKKKLIVDNNGQWKIVNPLLFRVTMGNVRNANTRLDDIIYSRLNERIGRTEASVLISNKKVVESMLAELNDVVNEDVKGFGIRIVDNQIRKTDLPAQNTENIYNRMKTEREQKAKQFRSEGKEEAQNIISNADKEALILEAQAYKTALTIRGEGDAEAIRIYNEAYNKDPEFYEFYRTLQTYENTLKGKTKLVIDAKSPFAKYLFGPGN